MKKLKLCSNRPPYAPNFLNVDDFSSLECYFSCDLKIHFEGLLFML